MAIAIFRQYNDALDQVHANLYAELQAGHLRQGWGCVGNGASMTLRDGQGNQIPLNEWEQTSHRLDLPAGNVLIRLQILRI